MNRGDLRHFIEIFELQYLKDSSGEYIYDDLGEKVRDYVKVKELFAKVDTRIGGLLSGRPADTVMTTVTHKFTWNYHDFPAILSNKHKIKYRNCDFEINYSLNSDFKDEFLEVFATQKIN